MTPLTLWRPRGFGDFRKKTPKRTWLCEFLRSGMLYRPGKSLKTSLLVSKRKTIFLLGGCGLFVSGVMSGGLLGHLGPLCLALGANR